MFVIINELQLYTENNIHPIQKNIQEVNQKVRLL